MRRLSGLIFIALCVLGLVKASPAGASETVVLTNYFGCDSQNVHWRFTEMGFRDDQTGHHHKKFFITSFNRFTGQTLHENAFHGAAPWQAYVQSVTGGAGVQDCYFWLFPFPNAGYDSLKFQTTAGPDGWGHQSGYWRIKPNFQASFHNYGNWYDWSSNIGEFNCDSSCALIQTWG